MHKETSKHTKNNRQNFNVLGDILDTLRFRGSIFFRSKLAAPWGMSLSKAESPRFHIALTGNFVVGAGNVENDDKDIVDVRQMDIIMLPNGDEHWIADQQDRQLIPSEVAGQACELDNPLFQQGKITNRLICGQVHYDREILHPILDSLPSVMHFPRIAADDPIWMAVMLIDTEMMKEQGNQTPIIDRLTEVLFLQLLNKYVGENKEITGFFAALRDHRVYHALELIHQNPQTPWSLEQLGERVGMSRATLSRKFKDSVGVPPMTYISHWRMMKSHHLLKYSSYSVEYIAELVGFSTARTLNKAFQRHYSYTPSELRKSSMLLT